MRKSPTQDPAASGRGPPTPQCPDEGRGSRSGETGRQAAVGESPTPTHLTQEHAASLPERRPSAMPGERWSRDSGDLPKSATEHRWPTVGTYVGNSESRPAPRPPSMAPVPTFLEPAESPASWHVVPALPQPRGWPELRAQLVTASAPCACPHPFPHAQCTPVTPETLCSRTDLRLANTPKQEHSPGMVAGFS